MANIIPVTELRDTNKITEMCLSGNEPIYITKNGFGAMVLLNMKAYEAEQEELLLLRRIVSAKEGNTVEVFGAMAELQKKYGL